MKYQLPTNEIIDDYLLKKMSILKISKKFQVSACPITRILKENNVKIRTLSEEALKNSFDDTFFEKIDTEEKAYWLGFLYADGYVSARKSNFCKTIQYKLTIALAEIEPLNKFKKCINATHTIKNTNKGKYKSFSLNITSQKLYNQLVKLGCYQNKSLTLKFPTEEQVPKELIRHFVRGYFDGDGSVSKTTQKQKRNNATFIYLKSQIQICGTLEFLTSLLEKMPFKASIIKDKRKITNTWSLSFSGIKRSYGFYKWLYENSHVYLNRKKEKFEDIFKSFERGSTTIIGIPTFGLYKRGLRDSLVLYESVS